MKVHIYCLYDPITCKIRYIGRTRKPLNVRLVEHLSKARYNHLYYPNKPNPHRINWILSCIKNGYEPKIKLLCIVKGWSESHIIERQLINKHLHKRDLVNSDDKGEGSKNRTITDLMKVKISKNLKKFYESNYNWRAKCLEVYDLKGNFITTFPSATEFAEVINVNPRAVTRVAFGEHGRKQINGFQLKYCGSDKTIDEYIPLTKKGNVQTRLLHQAQNKSRELLELLLNYKDNQQPS